MSAQLRSADERAHADDERRLRERVIHSELKTNAVGQGDAPTQLARMLRTKTKIYHLDRKIEQLEARIQNERSIPFYQSLINAQIAGIKTEKDELQKIYDDLKAYWKDNSEGADAP